MPENSLRYQTLFWLEFIVHLTLWTTDHILNVMFLISFELPPCCQLRWLQKLIMIIELIRCWLWKIFILSLYSAILMPFRFFVLDDLDSSKCHNLELLIDSFIVFLFIEQHSQHLEVIFYMVFSFTWSKYWLVFPEF